MVNKTFEVGKVVGAVALTADEIITAFGQQDWNKVACSANIMIAVANKLKQISLEETV